MKKYLLLFFVCLSVQLQAQLIGYDVAFKYAPSIKISDSIQSFLIMNRSMNNQFRNYNALALQDYYNRKLNIYYILLDSLVADTIIQILGDQLYNSGRFDYVIPVERNLPRKQTYDEIAPPLNWEYVNTLCKRYNTDALIVLEKLDFMLTTKKDFKFDKELIDTSKELIKMHHAQVKIYYKAHWRIYDPNNRQLIVDREMKIDSVFWESSNENMWLLLYQIPAIKPAAVITGTETALQFSELIAPYTILTNRYIYKTLNPKINRSIKYADEGEWEKALKNWMDYSEHGSRRTKSKIMLNISTAYEIIGEREKAIDWAKKSLICYERERTQNYLNVLLTQNNILYAGK